MDVFSAVAACASLATNLVRSGRALATLYEKCRDASHSIVMMQTECTVLAAALAQLESAMTGNRASQWSSCPSSVVEAMDLSLTGCALTLSILEKEISKLTNVVGASTSAMGKSDRAKYVWKEESMTELLQQLRGQTSALTLLLKALDSSSIDQILQIVQAGQPTFQRVRIGAASIRHAHPEEKYVESVLDLDLFDSADSSTLYSTDTSGTDDKIQQNRRDSLTAVSEHSHTDPGPTEDIALPLGWERAYSQEHTQWFYINSTTKLSQWEFPGLSNPESQSESSPVTQAINQRQTPVRRLSNWYAKQRKRSDTLPAGSTTILQDKKAVNSAKEMPSTVTTVSRWPTNMRSQLEADLDSIRNQHSAAALVVGVVSADGPTELFLRGLRRVGSKATVTSADKCMLSVNDSMTLTLLAMLVDRGLLHWEDRLTDFLPTPLRDQVHDTHKGTTFTMFASSMSGICIDWFAAESLLSYLSKLNFHAKQARTAIASYYLSRPPDNRPGANCCWHQANSVVIALALEETTKQPFETLLKTMLFDPLKMSSASCGWPDRSTNSAARPTQPWGHHGTSKQPQDIVMGNGLDMKACFPYQGIHCTAVDYAIFVQFQLRCAMGVETSSLLSRDDTRVLFEAIENGGEYKCTRSGFSIGNPEWAHGPTYFMSGRAYGFSNTCRIAPRIGKAFFVLSNLGDQAGLRAVDDAVRAAILHQVMIDEESEELQYSQSAQLEL